MKVHRSTMLAVAAGLGLFAAGSLAGNLVLSKRGIQTSGPVGAMPKAAIPSSAVTPPQALEPPDPRDPGDAGLPTPSPLAAGLDNPNLDNPHNVDFRREGHVAFTRYGLASDILLTQVSCGPFAQIDFDEFLQWRGYLAAANGQPERYLLRQSEFAGHDVVTLDVIKEDRQINRFVYTKNDNGLFVYVETDIIPRSDPLSWMRVNWDTSCYRITLKRNGYGYNGDLRPQPTKAPATAEKAPEPNLSSALSAGDSLQNSKAEAP